jgi:hypothetical protein
MTILSPLQNNSHRQKDAETHDSLRFITAKQLDITLL